MGTWATGSFGNDAAMDFALEIKNFSDVITTLSDIEKVSDFLDADQASVALAACDVIAATIGRPPTDFPEEITISNETISDSLLNCAKAIVERVGTQSELADLWEEEDPSEWQDELEKLKTRLTPSLPYKKPEKKKAKVIQKDFLGYCTVCRKMVTSRNGFTFIDTDPENMPYWRYLDEYKDEKVFGHITIWCHRACVEEAVDAPHWDDGGSPSENTRKFLLRNIGYPVP
jgi:hypothetical protein